MTTHPLRVLLVEDNIDDAELILIELRRAGFRVTSLRVEAEAAMVAALETSTWDVVLSDFSLPGFGAIAALGVIARSGLDIPILVVSGTIGEDVAADMIRRGARDYVLKGNLARLGPSIRRELRDAESRRARVHAENMAHRLAAVVQSSLDAIISESLEGIITSWNPAAEQLYGWSAAEAIGRTTAFLIPPDRAEERDAALARIRRGERLVQIDTVRVHRDGRPIDVAISFSPVRDKTGVIVGISKSVRDNTERKQWEDERRHQAEALLQSEAQHRALADSLPNLVWVAGSDGRVLYFSSRWAEYTGVPVDELKTGTRADILHPDDLTGMRERWSASVREGHPFETQYRVRRADGAYRWHIARSVPVRDAAGSIWRWFGTCTDIHDQRVLEESVARDALVLRHVRDSVIVTDLAGNVTYWNEGATRQYGWRADEMVGKPVATRVPDEGRRQLEDSLRAVLDGQDATGELHDYRKDGSRIWIHARFSRVVDRSGDLIGVMCISHDISDRRAAEEALRLRDRAIQAVTQGILITDPTLPDNPIIYASPGFERLTGYRASEVLGRNCRMLQVAESDPDAVARVRDAVRDGRAITEVLLNARRDKTTFWNELSISPVRDEEGRLTHFVGVQADVTERRKLEEQYRQAQKMEAIGQLAGGVAHDFNNLLCIINGYSDLLLQELPAQHPSRDMLEMIRKAGERSAGLTRQLLAFSRRQVIAPKVMNLNDSVSNLEKMLRRIIGEDVELATSLDTTLGSVCVDPGQIEQVIMNLAVNARDAMPEGGRLSIETKNVDLDGAAVRNEPGARVGAFVLLAVSDTGTGMSRETRDKIFEPFFTTKAVGKGTGLGLAVVHGIVQQNRGHISVVTQLGAGTTFQIYLPRVEEPPASTTTRRPMSGLPRGTETLLLVEDDDVVRALSRHVLAGCGYTVLDAPDGEQALRIAERYGSSIETLVTDVVMPGIGGRQLAEKMVALFPALKVLYVSGYTDDAIVRQGIEEDQISLLQKPFSPLALAARVRELLDRR